MEGNRRRLWRVTDRGAGGCTNVIEGLQGLDKRRIQETFPFVQRPPSFNHEPGDSL